MGVIKTGMIILEYKWELNGRKSNNFCGQSEFTRWNFTGTPYYKVPTNSHCLQKQIIGTWSRERKRRRATSSLPAVAAVHRPWLPEDPARSPPLPPPLPLLLLHRSSPLICRSILYPIWLSRPISSIAAPKPLGFLRRRRPCRFRSSSTHCRFSVDFFGSFCLLLVSGVHFARLFVEGDMNLLIDVTYFCIFVREYALNVLGLPVLICGFSGSVQ